MIGIIILSGIALKEVAGNLLPKNERDIQMKFPEGAKTRWTATGVDTRFIANSLQIRLQKIKKKSE